MYETPFHKEDIGKMSFLVTGGAGFIGSHLVEYLVKHKAGKVFVVDNLSTGNLNNLEPYLSEKSIEFHEIDINDCHKITELAMKVDYVLHQAALGSVPRSIKDPLASHESNATGFLSVLEACRLGNVKRLVYASSSSVYGDSQELPKREELIGRPKSPYAVTKLMDEAYGELYSRLHSLSIVGLRYFNIFGPRQNPKGPYAAAIPLFILEAISNGRPKVFGDGEQSRDFTFVQNAVQANIKALFSEEEVSGEVFNVACGERYSLNTVLAEITGISNSELKADYLPERLGDIRNSHASIEKASKFFDYSPEVKLQQGLEITYNWYKEHF